MVICGPQPQKTVPLIASQISDRDNAVRSAALNTMVIRCMAMWEMMSSSLLQRLVQDMVWMCAYKIAVQ